MESKKQPLLSIGMIFKNEVRCLERCLHSLQPLREAVPCQLVMADTGSDDGSREIAAQYADVLFDFPWVNDFSAARNAVLDRCTGQWHLSIDCDEWLDEDISELVEFLRTPVKWKEFKGIAFILRNYMEKDFNGAFNEFMAPRMLSMSLGMRYEGRIHERCNMEKTNVLGIRKPLIHHDGYIDFNQDNSKEKRERNMTLLRAELAERPQDLLLRMQCLESSAGEEQLRFVRLAVEGVAERLENWEEYGPPILRHAVNGAKAAELPELWPWIEQARELFPESVYVKVDVAYTAFVDRFDNKEYALAVQEGERYLQGLKDYRAWRFNPNELLSSALDHIVNAKENTVLICMSSAYHELGQEEQAWEALKKVAIPGIPQENVQNYTGMLLNLYAQAKRDTKQELNALWDEVEAGCRRKDFLMAASQTLTKDYREQEILRGARHACEALAVLADRCDLGRAARVISLESTGDIKAVLNQVEDWKQFSIHALIHALECGVTFPLPEKPLTLEEMDALADRIARAGNEILELTAQFDGVSFGENAQLLCWARALSMVVLQVFPWKNAGVENTERGLQAVRVFAHVERAFLHACYAESALTEARLFLLPPMHRFGWHVVQAFDALAAGDRMGYVRCLRNSLTANGDMGSLVEFLTENTPELQPFRPSAELQLLADQVRSLLMLYPEGDPMLEALKSSESYQRVAHLIEGTAPAIWGSLAQ